MTSRSSKAAAFSMDDFAQALAEHDYAFQQGQVVRGKPFDYTNDGAYIDIGGKSAAFLPLDEASLQPVSDLATSLPLQEEREFLVIGDQNAEGQVTLSIRRLEMRVLWERLTEMQDDNQSLQVRVTGLNKGGVTVDVQGLRGFVPRSHLQQREDLEQLKGTTLTVSILEIDQQRNKLVLSQRLASRSSQVNAFEIGQLVAGQITGIKPFGAFVDISGATGLLHIKEISQTFIKSLEDIFQVGENIQAIIIDLDQARGRISLSTKVLEKRAGEMLEHKAEVMAEAGDRATHYQEKLQSNAE
jgi:small subunit ribosomal protein S1